MCSLEFEAPRNLNWSKAMKGLFVAGNIKGEVKVYSLHDAINPELTYMVKQADVIVPLWLKKNSGLAAGYSGKLITFNKEDNQTKLTIKQVIRDKRLVDAIKSFDRMLEESSLPNICASRADKNAEIEQERTEWLLMQSLASEDKDIALCTLGFNSSMYISLYLNRIQSDSKTYLTERSESTNTENLKEISINTNWQEGPENLIRQNLLIGNLQTAIDCCFQCGRTVI